MMTTLPDCPLCGYPDLHRLIGVDLRYRCQECGWDSGALATNAEPAVAAELIERAVSDAKAMRAQRA